MQRLVAACIGVWLIACGALGAHHAAQVAHVVDRQTGAIVHAEPLSSAHWVDHADIHGQRAGGDHDACALATALHQPLRAPLPHANVSPITAPGRVAGVARAAGARLADLVYRLAPKTSPPAQS